MFRALILILLTSFALGACGRSAPTNYYTLTTQTPQTLNQDRLPKTTLRIARVAIPQYLDRESIVTKKKDEVQLKVDSVQVWAEPLSDGVRRIIHSELSEPLIANNLTVLPLSTESNGTFTLLIDILRLEGDLTDSATLRAQWSLVLSDSNRTIDDGIFSATAKVNAPSYQELVTCESKLVQNLGKHLLERIPRAVANYKRN